MNSIYGMGYGFEGRYLVDFQTISSGSLLTMLLAISLFTVVITLLARYAYRSNRQRILSQARIAEMERTITDLNHEKKALEKEIVRMERDHSNSEMLYGMMLSSAEDGIAFYNTDWELEFANTAYFDLIGMSQEEYGKVDKESRDEILLHPDDVGYARRREETLRSSGIFEAEIRIKHDGAQYLVLSSKSVTIKDKADRTLGYLVISRDITSIKETQNELQVAKERAEESNRLKSTFLANISHEIRTPLNSIVGFANLLNDSETDADLREEYVSYLNQNTERLLQIISDIIDLSRLENSEIEIHYNPVNINSILDYVEDYSSNLIKKSGKDIKFACKRGFEPGRDAIYADEVWLKRVFRHLLDNAVKFTRSGSVEITSAMAGTSMMFTVKDTGIGISKDHLKTIFEQFRQEVDGHHRPFEGLGVGLTLTRHVIEQMDGYLWVESEKGSGSEFFFTIPYRPVDSKTETPVYDEVDGKSVNHDWTGKTILVADDNHDILRYLQRILSDTGVRVLEARSGEEAVKIVKGDEAIDLVLLDMQMEEMTGLDATREIRKLRPEIPIVAQTAFVFEEEKDFIIEAGCDACLIKPVRQEQLYSVVASFIGNNLPA